MRRGKSIKGPIIVLMGPSVAAGDLSFEQWSQACAQRMSERRSFVSGTFETARDQIFAITQGRCRFSAGPVRERIPAFGYAQARIGDTTIQFLKWNSDDTECRTATARPQRQHMVLYIPLKGRFEARQGPRTVQA
ncbi:MAG: hypothetical protein ACREEP_17225, partial [Dongiaceae bacterium]